MKIYVVISDSIINNHSSHGLHGVYQNHSDAITAAISMIKSTVQLHGHNIILDDITIDDNELFYAKHGIDIVISCNDEPIFALFDDNGTPDNIYDDEILGVVLDRETAIYDELETALSSDFALERQGNDIKLSIK